jgi:uncharacterized protein YtpQ (UPF0354 family)
MKKYELVKKTEINGDVWYFIRKDDGYSVDNSWTTRLEEAERMLNELENGRTSMPIFETLKTIEVNDPNDN